VRVESGRTYNTQHAGMKGVMVSSYNTGRKTQS